ncbi:MAG: hypothetical protein R2831_01915 [Chitinophagaceae bacterium]
MNEKEFKETISKGIKSPSANFTDTLMATISSTPRVAPLANKKTFRILVLSCAALLVLSLFIPLPNFHFFQYSIAASPVIMPIICLSFICIILFHLYDINSKLQDLPKHPMVS